MSSRKILALLVSGLLAMPAAGTAQSRHQQGMDQSSQGQGMGAMMGQGTQGMHGMMMRIHSASGSPMMGLGMMGGMTAGPSPGLILQQRETLGLTDAQVQKLEALREQLAEARKSHMQAMRSFDQELTRQNQRPGVDIQAYESILRRRADQQVAFQMAMVRSGQETRSILTEEQGKKLRAGMQFMQGMMGMMSGQKGEMGAGAGTMGRMPCSMMSGGGS